MASRITSDQSYSFAEEILTNAQAGREIVQDFVPLAESLEWELGQQYLRERGNKAFISDAAPVPYIINNDGTLSRNAAEVFFASLVEDDKVGTLEDDIFVLELGIGVGLFARFFLDHFQELCARNNKTYYDRLCYVAADRSERMLFDVLRHGVLGNHLGHYCVRVVDALKPHETLPHDVRFQAMKGKPFRAVFLNYLLDCLPAAVLEINGDEVKQLCVRTCVARTVKLCDYTDMNLEQLQERARSDDRKGRQDLLEAYGLFASEYDYRPVDIKTIPFGEFALEYGRKITKRLLVNFGAMQCLSHLLDMVHDTGFILMNEYGHSQIGRDDDFAHQRFSYATAVGLNFPLLRAYFADAGKCRSLEPSGDDERGIHTRLASKQPSMDTTVRFQQLFSKSAFETLEEPIRKARGCLQHGRYELAIDFYQQALKLQPRNWVLLSEISSFLTFQMRNAKAAVNMAKAALWQNPTCSADLWSTLGDALYEFGRLAEARSAYKRAMSVNESDVRSHYSLASVFASERNYPAALRQIAAAFVLDKTGAFRDRLLQRHQEVLTQLHLRNQQENLLLANLISKYVKLAEKKIGEPAAATSPPLANRTDLPDPPLIVLGPSAT